MNVHNSRNILFKAETIWATELNLFGFIHFGFFSFPFTINKYMSINKSHFIISQHIDKNDSFSKKKSVVYTFGKFSRYFVHFDTWKCHNACYVFWSDSLWKMNFDTKYSIHSELFSRSSPVQYQMSSNCIFIHKSQFYYTRIRIESVYLCLFVCV